MSELKRTQLYDVHVSAGATMVDFGGWEMPIQYPSGIIAEHLYTRQVCGLFDVSHMGRLLIEGPQRKEFLQHVLTSNVSALDLNMAQYCIIPNENGGAVDDAYLYLFQEDSYLLVVNAANIDKDLEHLNRALSGFDCTITNISAEWASIAVQGPKSKEMLMTLSGGESPTKEPTKNSLGTVSLEGRQARIAKTGYTGEPLGYEVYVRSQDVVWLWNRLVELGARPAGLGARDTLRMEASFALYGHEMGTGPGGRPVPGRASCQVCRELLRPEGGFHRPRRSGASAPGFYPPHGPGLLRHVRPAPEDRPHRPAGPRRHAGRNGDLQGR